MKTETRLCASTRTLIGWLTAGIAILIVAMTGCTSCKKPEIAEDLYDDGVILNDDLVAYRTDDGKVSIKNATTGVVTIKDIKIDWTQRSRND